MPTKTKIVRPIRLTKPLREFPLKERRKIIAKDVLARFKRGQLIPSSGLYVQAEVKAGSDNIEQDLQKLLQQGARCEACAIGGAICSMAGFEDKVKLNESGYASWDTPDLGESSEGYVYSQVNSLMGRSFLQNIEAAFEGYFDDSHKAEAFHNMFTNDKARFVAIWEQVAKHGDFKPERHPDFAAAHKLLFA